MKFDTGGSEKIMWTMHNNMAYFNLPPCMIEHWDYVHKLNKTLVDLVEFLASDFHVSRRKLNPTATACAPSEKKISNDDSDITPDA